MSLFLAALLAVTASAAAPAPTALVDIGVAAAVRGSVSAQAPGQPAGRVIGSGKPVYQNDRVTTGPDSRLQILLRDETTFTIGPNSEMVLDEFVYDPASGAGKVSAEIRKGAFRFVTGKVAQRRPADMKVALPVGTIGIRGTMVEGRVDGRDADVLLTGPGSENDAHERRGGITVSNAAGSADIASGGYGTSIRGGGAPSAAYRFTPAQVEAIDDALEGPSSGRSASRGGSVPDGQAARSAGRDVAVGGINFQTTVGALVASQPDVMTFAGQQTAAPRPVPDGPTSWDQILAIQTGNGEYDGSGAFNCSGGPCGSGATETMTYFLEVDFQHRTLGGGGSRLQIGSGSDPVVDGSAIGSKSYAGNSGPSQASQSWNTFGGGLNFGPARTVNMTTTVSNASGQVATASNMTLTYSNDILGASGSVTKGPGTLGPLVH